MIRRLPRCVLGAILSMVFAGAPLAARDLYVAPGGTPAGPGTLSQPYDLASAFSGRVGLPGDTFWIRGGEYKLGHLDTSVQGAPGRPTTFRGFPGEKPRIDGSLTIYASNGCLTFRDFELYSSDTNRVSSQTGVGFNVTDITIQPGFSCFAPNLSFINLVVHDQTRHGIYLSSDCTNTFVYGCLLYNNGWVSPDNAEGHGIYVQGVGGVRTLEDNIVFNNSGANMHVYDNEPGTAIRGMTLIGNVAFNAGAIQQMRPYRDWTIGVDSPALYADKIVLRNNMGYLPPGLANFAELQIGRDSTNGLVTLTSNYMPVGLEMNNWQSAVVSGNVFGPASANSVVALSQTLTPLHAVWDNNLYLGNPAGADFELNTQTYTLSAWRAATGFDRHSRFLSDPPQGLQVFLRPNLYQPRRANIIVYNWDNLNNVTVSVRSVLPLNSSYEVRSAQNYLGPPVLSGVYHGEAFRLPMTNLTVAVPTGPKNGPLAAPPPTSPTFNVFVLLPRS